MLSYDGAVDGIHDQNYESSNVIGKFALSHSIKD